MAESKAVRLFAINCGFLAGIGAATLGVIAVPVAVGILFLYRSKWLATCALCGACAGFAYYSWHAALMEGRYEDVAGVRISAEARIRRSEIRYDEYQYLMLELDQKPYIVTAATPRFPEYVAGSIVKIAGTVREPRNPHDYPRLEQPAITDMGPGPFAVIPATERARGWVVRTIESYLEPRQAALLAGVITGDERGFTRELQSAMRASGAAHLVALSGYNVTIVIAAVTVVLRSFLSPFFTLLTACVAVAGLAIGGGLSASIVRAAIMGIIVLLAGYQGRTPVAHYLLAATAALMALSDPTILVYDIGFQLSFASMAGITYATPRIQKLLAQGRGGLIRDVIATTAGAHIAVLPLVWWYFGNFSPLSLATNILIVPLIPLVMGTGTLLVAGAAASNGFASIITLILDPILRYILTVIIFFGS